MGEWKGIKGREKKIKIKTGRRNVRFKSDERQKEEKEEDEMIKT